MDVLADVSGRVKEINLVELLTRDVVDLVGDHIDLFRRNQSAISVDVMQTLSSEERDEKLKQQLRASKELHPALKSPDCEYKALQHLMGGVLAVALRPREAKSPLIRCIARELLTCLLLCGGLTTYTAVFLCPVFFSLAHLNHLLDTLQHRSLLQASVVVGFQLGYTVIFGWYASFLFVRTDAMLRGKLLDALTAFGHDETIGEATKRFHVFLNDRETQLLPPDISRAAYTAVMQSVTKSNRSNFVGAGGAEIGGHGKRVSKINEDQC